MRSSALFSDGTWEGIFCTPFSSFSIQDAAASFAFDLYPAAVREAHPSKPMSFTGGQIEAGLIIDFLHAEPGAE
jgi:hypothetical protein